MDGLQHLLAADVQLVGDGGGKAPNLSKTVIGALKVAKVLASYYPVLAQVGVSWEPHEVNGQPGAIFLDRDGRVLSTMILEMLDGQIQAVRSVSNPDKLEHLGPVADAWSISEEVRRARKKNAERV